MAVPFEADPVPMSDEQKFVFDLKGWLLLPAVLDDDFIATLKEQLHKLKYEPDTVPETERTTFAGPAQELIDHPAIVGILSEIIGPPRAGAYGFRCENSFSMIRTLGQKGNAPHCGPIVGPMACRMINGQIYSGLTRIAWELNPVKKGQGGTYILSGSHKANFPVSEIYRGYDSPVFESYSCPAGSALIFTESCWHVGAEWSDPDVDRYAIFNCYSSYLARWHKVNIAQEVIQTMPAKRRELFRGVWGKDFSRSQPNNYFDESNQAL